MTKLEYPAIMAFKRGNNPKGFENEIVSALKRKGLVLDKSSGLYYLPFGSENYSYDLGIGAGSYFPGWMDLTMGFQFEFPDLFYSPEQSTDVAEMRELMIYLFKSSKSDILLLTMYGGAGEENPLRMKNGIIEFLKNISLRGKIKHRSLMTIISNSLPVLGRDKEPFEREYQRTLKIEKIDGGRLFSEY